jgi:hypothetical protein
VGFLEIARADFCRWYVGCDRKHGHPRTMTVKQAVDKMQIAWSATAGADGKLAGQVRCRECSRFFMAHMDPFDLALAPKRVGQTIQAIADNAIDTLDACRGESLRELVRDGFGHITSP